MERWVARYLLFIAAAAPLLYAGVALAEGSPDAWSVAAERTPVVALIVLFSSSALAGTATLFWKVFRSQQEVFRSQQDDHRAVMTALSADHRSAFSDLSDTLRGLRDVLDARLPPR